MLTFLGWKSGLANFDWLGLGNSKGTPSTPREFGWNPILGCRPVHEEVRFEPISVSLCSREPCPWTEGCVNSVVVNSGFTCRQKHTVMSHCMFWLAGSKLWTQRSLPLLIKPRRRNTSKISSFNLYLPPKKKNCDIFGIPKREVKTSKLDGMSLLNASKIFLVPV